MKSESFTVHKKRKKRVYRKDERNSPNYRLLGKKVNLG